MVETVSPRGQGTGTVETVSPRGQGTGTEETVSPRGQGTGTVETVRPRGGSRGATYGECAARNGGNAAEGQIPGEILRRRVG